MKQKAFCNDWDRLNNAEADLSNQLRMVPVPTDGGSTDPTPSVSTGDSEDRTTPPGLFYRGRLYAKDDTGAVVLFNTADDSTGVVGYTELGRAYYLTMPGWSGDLDSFIVTAEEQHPVCHAFVGWNDLRARMNAMRDGVIALTAWAASVTAADNSDARAALAECQRRLADLESAFAETFRKWREH